MKLMKQRLRRLDIDKDPNLIWNRFIAILAETELALLSPAQRRLSLVFWYESEVQNGGHLQFFSNMPEGSAAETVLALQGLQADAHAAVLVNAIRIWQQNRYEPKRDVGEYVAEALEGRFASLDDEFYALRPTLINLLEVSLESDVGAFFDFD